MAYITWDYYQIWYGGRSYQVLIPKDISQFWTIYYMDINDRLGVDVDFFGNRSGLEALRNACAALSEKENMVIYFPCKKNNHLLLCNFCFQEAAPECYEFVDLVFMKPNSIKIKDWKEIRRRLFKMKSRQWGYDFQCDFSCIRKKYRYREEEPKVIYRYDTLFCNALSFVYKDLAYGVEEFLEPDLKKNFYEDIKREDGRLRGETIFYGQRWDEFGAVFWANDIYQKARIKYAEKYNVVV